jgi:alpha-beta hydrolase superfamily lysophospholipase
LKDSRNQKVDEYIQDELFWKESKKEYVKMGDGAELLCFYTNNGNNPKKPTILFIPGYGTGVFSWSDLWDELFQDYDFYVLDSREKATSKVKWKHKGDMNTLGHDIKEVIEHFNFNHMKLFIIF